MKRLHALAIACACTFLVAAYGEDSNSVDYDFFADIVAKKSACIVDANSTATFIRLHVPGALSFYASDFETRLPSDKGALIVVYCASARCHAWQKAADRLLALGYTNVKHFPGGFEVWRQHDGAIEKGMHDPNAGLPAEEWPETEKPAGQP